MTKPFSDLEFLSNPSAWKQDAQGRRRCCVKSVEQPGDGWPKRFGVIYEEEPTTVYLLDAKTETGIKYLTVKALCDVWRVD